MAITRNEEALIQSLVFLLVSTDYRISGLNIVQNISLPPGRRTLFVSERIWGLTSGEIGSQKYELTTASTEFSGRGMQTAASA
jgi:hypothetical protein